MSAHVYFSEFIDMRVFNGFSINAVLADKCEL